MTKKQMKRFNKAKQFAETKNYSNFARMHGFEFTECTPIEEDLFGDGIPRCICVYKNNNIN